MVYSKEQRAEYYKQYRLDNKQKNAEYNKKYYIENKEKAKQYQLNNKNKIVEYNKEYRLNHKEYYKEYYKEYKQTDAGKKLNRITNWKRYGVISTDFDDLYDKYINTKNCDNCDTELIHGWYGSNKKCLDHDHKTGLFRNILCHNCNVKRK